MGVWEGIRKDVREGVIIGIRRRIRIGRGIKERIRRGMRVGRGNGIGI